MNTPDHSKPGRDGHPDAVPGYEQRDVRMPLIVWSFVSLAILAIAALFTIQALIRAFESAPAERVPIASGQSRAPSIAAEPGAQEATQGPLLQDNPAAEMAQRRAEQIAVVQSYGRVPEAPSRAHIPVEVAMERVVKDGLPEWEAPREERSNVQGQQQPRQPQPRQPQPRQPQPAAIADDANDS